MSSLFDMSEAEAANRLMRLAKGLLVALEFRNNAGEGQA